MKTDNLIIYINVSVIIIIIDSMHLKSISYTIRVRYCSRYSDFYLFSLLTKITIYRIWIKA